MLVNVMLVALLGVVGLVGGQAGQQTYTKCTDVPNQPYSQADIVAGSPWMMLRSSDPSFACTVGVMTGPTLINGEPNYSALLFSGTTLTHSLNVNAAQDQANSSIFTNCLTSDSVVNKFLHNDLTSANPYFIVYYCDETTGAIPLVKAYATNVNTGTVIDQVLGQYLSNIPGGTTVNVWQTCACGAYCSGYLNRS